MYRISELTIEIFFPKTLAPTLAFSHSHVIDYCSLFFLFLPPPPVFPHLS